jgi:predicted nucleic acid-binding protein
MSLIVADTGPINYLIQIGHVDLLSRLVGKMVIPSSVQAELLHGAASVEVRAWAAQPPAWVEIRVAREQPAGAKDVSATDQEAIVLAKELNASLLLMDDQRARRYACAFWGGDFRHPRPA